MVVNEFYNGDKKAVIRKNDNRWQVVMYLNSRVIQMTDAISENTARNIAEDYVNESAPGSPLLLKEGDV
jgi:hypothetical protein